MSDAPEDTTNETDRLSFMLSQLRSDLDDLIEGLESNALPYETAKAGAEVQLAWVLQQLQESNVKASRP